MTYVTTLLTKAWRHVMQLASGRKCARLQTVMSRSHLSRHWGKVEYTYPRHQPHHVRSTWYLQTVIRISGKHVADLRESQVCLKIAIVWTDQKCRPADYSSTRKFCLNFVDNMRPWLQHFTVKTSDVCQPPWGKTCSDQSADLPGTSPWRDKHGLEIRHSHTRLTSCTRQSPTFQRPLTSQI